MRNRLQPILNALCGARLPLSWLGIARRTLAASVSDRVSLAAGGCAFFTTLSIFPAMNMLIAAYGLVFKPRSIEPQLQYLRELLPPEVYELIARWMHHLVLLSGRRLGVGIGVSTLITLWSAAIGTRALLTTLNAAYGAGRRGGFFATNALALTLTMAAIGAAIVGIGALTLMPVAIAMLDLSQYRARLIHLAGTVLLIGFAGLFIALLYRFGPRGHMPKTRRLAPGAVLATVLWLGASGVLSLYIDHVARFGATYGPLGAVIGLMLWFYLTFYAVLLGAELNAQMERHAAERAVAAEAQRSAV